MARGAGGALFSCFFVAPQRHFFVLGAAEAQIAHMRVLPDFCFGKSAVFLYQHIDRESQHTKSQQDKGENKYYIHFS